MTKYWTIESLSDCEACYGRGIVEQELSPAAAALDSPGGGSVFDSPSANGIFAEDTVEYAKCVACAGHGRSAKWRELTDHELALMAMACKPYYVTTAYSKPEAYEVYHWLHRTSYFTPEDPWPLNGGLE